MKARGAGRSGYVVALAAALGANAVLLVLLACLRSPASPAAAVPQVRAVPLAVLDRVPAVREALPRPPEAAPPRPRAEASMSTPPVALPPVEAPSPPAVPLAFPEPAPAVRLDGVVLEPLRTASLPAGVVGSDPAHTSGAASAAPAAAGSVVSGLETYGIDEVDTAPRVLVHVPPVYPDAARRRGMAGWVRATFVVTALGGVTEVRIEGSEGGAQFEDAVRSALRAWRFSPAAVGGRPVGVRCVKEFNFRLEE